MNRIATEQDFKVGVTLIDSQGNRFTIYKKYDEGIWEARGYRGNKCLFSSEAQFYKVA